MALPPPSLRLALIASLAVNVFLIAAFAAPHLMPDRPRERSESRIAERIAGRLPEADRPIFRETHARHQAELARSFETMREARRQVRATLEAEPFDRAAFDRAAEASQQASEAAQGAIHAMIAEAAPRMSAKGRRFLAPGPRRD